MTILIVFFGLQMFLSKGQTRLGLKVQLVCKKLIMFRPLITKLQIQAYIQTIYMQNMKYKQYLIWKTTLTHN